MPGGREDLIHCQVPLPEATSQRLQHRSGRERRNRLQRRKHRDGNKSTQQQVSQHIQTTLHSFVASRYQIDSGAGHRITEDKNLDDIRFFLQNPSRVLNKDGKLDDRRAYLSLREWGVDVITLPETNKHWELEWLRKQWAAEVRQLWQHAKVYTSCITAPTDKYSTHVQGGVGLIITERWASRVVASGSDSLGRWVWVTL